MVSVSSEHKIAIPARWTIHNQSIYTQMHAHTHKVPASILPSRQKAGLIGHVTNPSIYHNHWYSVIIQINDSLRHGQSIFIIIIVFLMGLSCIYIYFFFCLSLTSVYTCMYVCMYSDIHPQTFHARCYSLNHPITRGSRLEVDRQQIMVALQLRLVPLLSKAKGESKLPIIAFALKDNLLQTQRINCFPLT